MADIPRKILIVGAGAIGAFYGSLLDKAGAEVSVVCRSDYEIVKGQGFLIDSADLGRYRFLPKGVYRDVRDYPETADYAVLCTKVLPGLDRAELLRPLAGPQTALVFIQNGVDIEAELVEAFPGNALISGLAFICCNRLEPGHVAHLAYGRLLLGDPRGGFSEKIRELCALFQSAGIECNGSRHIVADRWLKCVWNAPFNPLSVLSGGLSTAGILAAEEPFVRRIMEEVCRIAEALGHALPADAVDWNIDLTRRMPAYKTSMLLDYERGHPLESEAILGNALRAAKRVNMPCPHLESLYALLRLKLLADRMRPAAPHPSDPVHSHATH